jgi:hypothetical protein
MNGFWTKVLVSAAVIALLVTYLAWPRHLPPPEEKNRAWSLGRLSMVAPEGWEGIPIKPDQTFDDGLMLRPKAEGRRQASVTVRRYRNPPKLEDLTNRRDKVAKEMVFNGYPGYYIEGNTQKEYLYRQAVNVNGKWHVIILSNPLPIEFEGSEWQDYFKTFRAADDSATSEPSTAPVSQPA